MSDVVTAIQRQTQGINPREVYVIQLHSVRFGSFTPDVTSELSNYSNIQMLTINDCGLTSLNGFPRLPSLIRLDLVMNQIPGTDLVHLTGCHHLQTLMLGGNNVTTTDELRPLTALNSLSQLDLIRNPVERETDYRKKVFDMFPSLRILDTLNKEGKDSFNTATMADTAARIPTGLFDTRPSVPSGSLFGAPRPTGGLFPSGGSLFGTGAPSGGLFGGSAPSGGLFGGPRPAGTLFGGSSTVGTGLFGSSPATGGLFGGSFPALPVAPARSAPRARALKGGKSGKTGRAIRTSRSASYRSGLTFPVGRIRRHIKALNPELRVSKLTGVFMAAVLEYLTAQMLELAGTATKDNKRARITPKMLQLVITKDEQLSKLLSDVTIPRQE